MIAIALSQSVVVAVLLSVGTPFLADLPDARHAPYIVLAALQAVGSLLLLAWAYARGQANYLSSSEYTAFVWAALFGYLLFGERVAGATLLGAACIITGCLLAARQKPSAMVDLQAQL